MLLPNAALAASLSQAISSTRPLLSSGAIWSEQDWVTELSNVFRNDSVLKAHRVIPFVEFRMNFREVRKGNQHADLALWDRTAMRLVALIEVKHSREKDWNLTKLESEVDDDRRKILEGTD